MKQCAISAINNNYEIGVILSNKQKCSVVLVKHKLSSLLAILKYYKLSEINKSLENSIMQTISYSIALKHCNIMKCYDYIMPDQHNIIAVIEVAAHGHLYNQHMLQNQTKIPEIQAKAYITQIITALMYLQTTKFCNYTVKLNDIYKSFGAIKISLFQIGSGSKCVYDEKYYTSTIKEQTNREKENMWRLGVICYLLLSGAFPFDAIKESKLQERAVELRMIFPNHLINFLFFTFLF